MALRDDPPFTQGRPFGWRDAWCYGRAMARLALRRDADIPFTALARISAVDVRALPRQRWFEASDGARLGWRTYDGGSACQLILIHGSACFADQFQRLATTIAARGLATVHTLDMRGHGQSAPEARYADRYAIDIGEFAAHLRRASGDAPIAIGGHSAGGGLVLNALRSPYLSGIAGCLLFAPYMAIDSKTMRPFFGGWLKRIYRARLLMVAAANLVGVRRFNDLPVVEFDSEAFVHDPRYARTWSFATVFGFGPGPVSSRRINDMPVALLAGTSDNCFRSEHYAAALRAVAPQGSITLLSGLGHWDVLTDPQALETCCAWLATHFGGAAREHETPARRHA